MNKLPAKQIYLLAVIIVGIIALSVYSTYALFTFESSTSDIVSIHTPKSLTISENVYEYQQIVAEPNTITTTDIDIYNTFDYDVCYSIWYKVVGSNIDTNKVQIFELSSDNLTSSGVLSTTENIRVTIAIINDNDETAKINLGTIGAKKENDSCSLNLATDKNQISSSYKEIEILSEKLLEEKDIIKEEPAGYITSKDETAIITYRDTDKIYISDKFKYDNEIFTLEDPIETTVDKLVNKSKLENKDTYFCKETDSCSILYKITTIEKEERIIKESSNEEEIEKEIYYHIKLYDKLIGYSKGTNGLRKINEKDYVFYGDNPNNYIYYNCETDNVSTCELWRIIGLFYNHETDEYNLKIIRNESIEKYQFDSKIENDSLTWTNSTLYEYLNEEYKFINNYDTYIEEYNQNTETLLSLEDKIKKEKNTVTSKINIVSLSDYINTSSCEKNKLIEYAGECLTNNWLNNIEISTEWTQTLKEQEEIKIETEDSNEIVENEDTPTTEETSDDLTTENLTDENNIPETNVETNEENSNEVNTILANYAYGVGNSIVENNVNDSLDIRPVVYLKSRMLLVGGEGTFLSPYVIK